MYFKDFENAYYFLQKLLVFLKPEYKIDDAIVPKIADAWCLLVLVMTCPYEPFPSKSIDIMQIQRDIDLVPSKVEEDFAHVLDAIDVVWNEEIEELMNEEKYVKMCIVE